MGKKVVLSAKDEKYFRDNWDKKSYQEMNNESGYKCETIRKIIRRDLNLPYKRLVNPEVENNAERIKNYKIIKENQHLTFATLSKMTGISKDHIRNYVFPKLDLKRSARSENLGYFKDTDIIQEVEKRGYRVEKEDVEMNKKVTITMDRFTNKKVIVGVVSDTHFCSKYQQKTALNNFYDLMAKRKINTVINCGDLVDGYKVYRGQDYEIFEHGCDSQMEYFINNYPCKKDITTYILGGNHDYSWFQNAGINILSYIIKERQDMKSLGFFHGITDIEGIKLGVGHDSRSSSTYAKSYPLQKIIEGFAPENKPDFYLLGHFHNYCLVTERNCEGILVPCFQAQTPFLQRKKLFPIIAGLIVSFEISHQDRKNGISNMQIEKIPYYVPMRKDY